MGRVVALIAVLAIGCLPANAASGADSPANDLAIRQTLDAQVEAWNRADLEAFMAGYWHSPELTFFANEKENRGWQAAFDRYKQRYQGNGRAMGKLDFHNLRIEMLGPDAAFVRGQWHLLMPDKSEPHGLFTLVLRRFPNQGWKIVHDHTSGS